MATVCLTPEPAGIDDPQPIAGETALERLEAWLARAVVAPFVDLVRRNGASGLVVILLFTVLYKLGEAVAGTMSNPLYVLLGFTKVEIATVAKIYGVGATSPGSPLADYGPRLVLRAPFFGVLQMLEPDVWRRSGPADVFVLTLTIGTENLTNGMGSAAFVAYLRAVQHRLHRDPIRAFDSLMTIGINLLSAWAAGSPTSSAGSCPSLSPPWPVCGPRRPLDHPRRHCPGALAGDPSAR
jgi:PAT family beta-lactamase induction signal transducer AmpG